MPESAALVQSSLVVLRVSIPEVYDDQVASTLREQLRTLYEQSGATHAILDMEAVMYLSSVGIAPLLALLHKVRERGGRLILAGLTRDVEDVLHATKLIASSQGMSATFEYQQDVPASVQCLYPKAAQADSPL